MYGDESISVKMSFLDSVVGENENLKRQLFKASVLLDFLDEQLDNKKGLTYKNEMLSEVIDDTITFDKQTKLTGMV